MLQVLGGAAVCAHAEYQPRLHDNQLIRMSNVVRSPVRRVDPKRLERLSPEELQEVLGSHVSSLEINS